MRGAPPSPPRIARALLLAAASPASRWHLVDDLDEEFAMRAEAGGAGAAARWYWLQAAASVPSLLLGRVRRLEPRAPGGGHTVEGDSVLREAREDVRLAVRRARRNPVVAATVIVSTALAVAAATAVFSVINALLLRPLPLPEPERLVRIVGLDSRFPESQWGGVSFLNAKDLAERTRSIERLALYNQNWSGTLHQDGEPRTVSLAIAGQGLAETLGLRPMLGRSFVPEEHVPGADAVMLLTHEGWQRELGGDSAIVGRTIVLDDRSYTVVGVLPPTSLAFPKEGLTGWVPLAPPTTGPAAWRSSRGADWLRAVARLRPGATMAQARAELDAVARQLASDYPEDNRTRSYRLVSLQDSIVGPARPMLWLLGGAVAAVLLIACGNVAMLLLAHAQSRRRELAVRAALGGAGGRITRQLLTESLALAAVGGALGVAVTPFIVSAFLALYPGALPRATEIVLDARALVVSLAVIAAAGVAAGLPAARQARRGALGDSLRDAGRSGSSRGERRLGGALVGSQVAFSVVLLFGAALLIRSFWNLTRLPLGFESRGVLTFLMTPSGSRHPSVSRLYDELDASLRALPGVVEVSSSYDLPTAGRAFGSAIIREGTSDAPNNAPLATVQMVSPRLFATLGIPLRAGRDFDARDRFGAPFVVVVNETFAARMFPGGALGRRITVWNEPHTIVGIVGDARLGMSLWEPPEPQMYFSADQRQQGWRFVAIRTVGDPAALVPAVRAELRRLDPTLPLAELATLDERVARSMAPQRFRGTLIGVLGALALLLSVVGIYGVVAHAAGRRTREIGIRLALGEGQQAVRRRIVRGALVPASIGTAVGVAAALAAARWIESFVLGVSARDAATLAGVAALFLVATVLAAYAPARRASRVDPTTALRVD